MSQLLQLILGFINRLRGLLISPSGHLPEIIISLGIILVAVAIMGFVGIAVFSAVQGWLAQRRRGHLELAKRTPRLPALLLYGAVAIGLLLVIAAGLPVTSNPQFCGRVCHSMNPQHQSWRRSAHASVSCVKCHSSRSITGRLVAPFVLGLSHIDEEGTGRYRKPIAISRRAVVSDATCLSCHRPKKRLRSDMLAMDHRAHTGPDMRCVTCHNRVAHPRAEKYAPIRSWAPSFEYKDLLKMRQGCWRCHRKGGRFVDAKGKLHVGPYRTAAGAKAPTNCETCHPRYWVRQLEVTISKVRARHFKTPPWTQGTVHGETARRVRFTACQVCHNPARRCTVCHKGITMPHADYWINPQAHGVTAKATNFEPCRLCHNTKIKTVPSCSARGHHHERFVQQYGFNLKQPDWRNGKERHGVVAKATGGQPCFRCHEQKSWCTTQCHRGITMPHIAGWRGIHFTQDRSICPMCHNKDGKNPNFCFNCHHSEFIAKDPKIQRNRDLMRYANSALGALKNLSRGVEACAKCHGPELKLCRGCHAHQPD